MRIAVLFSRLSGYMATCLETLCDEFGAELMVVRIPPAKSAPFDERHFQWMDRLYDRDALSVEGMLDRMREFTPDAIFMAGWFDDGYLQVARAMRQEDVPVVASSDAQWTGSWRQQLGRVVAPWYLHTAIDVLWVAGERQRQLARQLGYTGKRCWTGCYACDWSSFAGVADGETDSERSPSFLYVGRYTPVKGIDVLLDAYRAYRNEYSGSWGLTCAGAGEQKNLLDGTPGVADRGFVQPDQLPHVMREATAFVLPSRREPWGVVLQEAGASKLPLICSDACGAGVHLLQDGYNGYLFESENADHLAECLVRMEAASVEERRDMGERSHELSKQYTPERWARTFVQGLRRIRFNRTPA